MADFIKYVVSELKSKRLSKEGARSLLDQFVHAPAAAAQLHPLLHVNISDLHEQSYACEFDGSEVFLADHLVSFGGGGGRRVLPAVAYLEMAREAIARALPGESVLSSGLELELRQTVWARPVVVDERREVRIALQADAEGGVGFEVYSLDADGAEQVHCQGRGVHVAAAGSARLPLGEIAAGLDGGSVAGAAFYARLHGLGLRYGPAHQAIEALRVGASGVLAQLRLPGAAARDAARYVLHPSLMDAALQACLGLAPAGGSEGLILPYAVESVRVLGGWSERMLAWVRLAPGSTAGLRKLDIDLCAEDGAIRVQMRGFSARAAEGGEDMAAAAGSGLLWAVPAWSAQAVPGACFAGPRHVLLCGLAAIVPAALGPACVRLESTAGDVAGVYAEQALAAFAQLRAVLAGPPAGPVLVQVVTDQALALGLGGLLRTAAAENPLLRGQVVLVEAGIDAASLAARLAAEDGGDVLVRWQDGRRSVQVWREQAWGEPAGGELVPAPPAPVALREDGVYLITGGLGGLGRMFAEEITRRTASGRVVLSGRGGLDAARAAQLAALAGSDRIGYRQVDLSDPGSVDALIAGVLSSHGRLDGILHGAGQTADNYLLKKSAAEMRAVLEPKVAGTVNLDLASRDVALDFLVLFASVAGALGNAGQGDYAAGNGFMDQYAQHRQHLAAQGRRHGRTLSIDWPLWAEGGMRIDAASQRQMQAATGAHPLATAPGLQAFHAALAQDWTQVLVLQGNTTRLRQGLERPAWPFETAPAPAIVAAAVGVGLEEQTQDHLRGQLSGVLQLPASRIDAQAPLETYGIDSVMAMSLTRELEKSFGPLSKTLFFEHQTLADLARYFLQAHAGALAGLFAQPAVAAPAPAAAAVPVPPGRRRAGRGRAPAATPDRSVALEPIAIIGLSGRYPGAWDVGGFWGQLRGGVDCITEVPAERWDWRACLSEDRTVAGRHYSKWGGFIGGVDEFDPLFFGISPREARLLDPQERLFLEHAWMAMEDAGYTRSRLQVAEDGGVSGQVGVYVGAMYSEYQLLGAEATGRGQPTPVFASFASIANRVSYVLNLHGPSLTVDTMCSSSLTAIHVACQDLRLGRTRMAIAGGVNVSIHPHKYLMLSAGQFISSDGHCQSFGEGGDGYIPGEGVGAVLLKRLPDAQRDGDHVWGVILGSALSHGGKTNGYTVPNPQAQGSVIAQALAEARVDARHVSYVEAHGTGTKLGDPIEIAALSQAFGRHSADVGYCRIGSAKSNIGHCESAAGIAGLTKVLLQMRHREIVPSLHSARLNPHIDFARTPFVVNQSLVDWQRPRIDGREVDRIAGLSSFGAGGSNAHMIVREYRGEASARPGVVSAGGPERAVIVLSARTPEQLRQKACDLVSWLAGEGASADLAAVAYTLQVGREAMDERLGLLAGSLAELSARLGDFLAGAEAGEAIHRGQAKRSREGMGLISQDDDMREAVDKWIARRKYTKLLELWVKGLDVDWDKLHGATRPRRVSLPSYPFARERYWIEVPPAAAPAAAAQLHPLLHVNISDLHEQSYACEFDGSEVFLADHLVSFGGGGGRRVLPAVAYLEMAREAIARALPGESVLSSGLELELRQTVWARPVVVDERREVRIALQADAEGGVGFEVYSLDADGAEQVHCQGRGVHVAAAGSARLPLGEIAAGLDGGSVAGAAFYARLHGLGLRYGPAHQAIEALRVGASGVLAQLRLPGAAARDAARYVLHPSLMDAALQACLGLAPAGGSEGLILPYAVESVRVLGGWSERMLAWVRLAPGSTAGLRKLDIDLCAEDGAIRVQMRGFSARAAEGGEDMAAAAGSGLLWAVPAWSAQAVPGACFAGPRHVLLCGLAAIVPAALGPACVRLESTAGDVAGVYAEQALAAFAQLRAVLAGPPAGPVLVQVVTDQALALGLGGLLRTAAAENPLLRGQVVLVEAGIDAASLAARLAAEDGGDVLVRWQDGRRSVQVWREQAWGEPAGGELVPAPPAPVALREDGVYLITGGLGGLGRMFAEEITRRTASGRVVLSGRGGLDAARAAQLAALAGSDRIGYRQVDLSDPGSVDALIAGVLSSHGRLDGILHGAGQTADNYLLKKSAAEMRAVLEPKVAGTVNLDLASRDVALDFLVLFASVAGALGNAGQGDYAAGNGFMDQYAQHRQHLAAQGRRHGRTLSIDWPLWAEGGMRIDAASQRQMQAATGAHPLATAPGLQAFHAALAQDWTQVLVLQGNTTRLRQGLERPAWPFETAPAPAIVAAAVGVGLEEQTQDHLRGQLSGVLQLPASRIDAQAPLETYGIDSVMAMSLTRELEKSFGPLSKTLFFEHQTLADLARYFLQAHAGALAGLFAQPAVAAPAPAAAAVPVPPGRRRAGRGRAPAATPDRSVALEPIAIIGLSGRYPGAWDVGGFWGQLRGGVDCITEVPAERWDWRACLSEDRTVAGRHYSKWGGFIGGVDEFDPLFFGISPREARLLDPQERLFLEHAWMAMEDAGYTRSRLQVAEDGGVSGQVGVYVGAMYSEYQLLGAEATGRGQPTPVFASFASIANRVSYVLNLHGPSLTVDTMCSSSLTAIHVACQDLRLGRTRMAIAGGVNVSIHPHKYLMLSAGQFISSDGHCQSFGEGGDGYIPGEGVGAVLLKRLPDAQRDGDHVWGVILGSALSHGGKTNGYTVPNPQAQGSVIAQALAEARVDARHVSYVEAHGTGTKLGDPIEIAALSQAFGRHSADVGYCRIGSAKSNIGHCESAAGIAGLTKVLLQMRHREIVPSLHSARLNPHIDFARTPFVVNQSLVDWQRPRIDGREVDRIAGLSSFGAGGSNAHMIVREYRGEASARPGVVSAGGPERAVIVLSARTPEQLRQKACDLVSWLAGEGASADLAAVAYTLQVGREAMDERLGLLAGSLAELSARLGDFLAGAEAGEAIHRGQAKRSREGMGLISQDDDMREAVDKWIARRKYTKLLELWVKGLDVDWDKLHGATRPRRVSLPSYPFARERYWIEVPPAAAPAAAAQLHPLLHVNISDLHEQSYACEFDGSEVFLADHLVSFGGGGGRRVLPAVAYLEMAREAIARALPGESVLSSGLELELRQTVWARPVVVDERREVRIALQADAEGGVGFEVYSLDADGAEQVHCQGRGVHVAAAGSARLPLGEIAAGLDGGSVAGAAFYARLHGLGLRYGPAHQAIEALRVGASGVLAQLRLPGAAARDAARYVLHPSLMDAALQACLGLAPAGGSEGLILPYAVESVRVLGGWSERMLAWVRLAPGSTAGLRKLDIDLCAEDGAIRVQMRGFSARAAEGGEDMAAAAGSGLLWAVPAWSAQAVPGACFAGPRHVLLCGLAAIVPAALGPACVRLESTAGDVAGVYAEQALAAFAQLRAVLAGPPAGPVLVQVVTDQALALGLGGLLRTAAAENPLLRGQVVLVEAGIDAASLAARLAAEDGGDVLVRWQDGRRSVQVWREQAWGEPAGGELVPAPPAPVALREDGVYLITGGLGGLGRMFAEEITRRTASGRVVLSGRGGLDAARAAQLAALAGSDRIGYRQVDLSDPGSVDALIAGVLSSHGRLDGILHGAGQTADNYLLKKSAAEMRAVLEPKVAGTVNLDLASRDVALDFLVLFASVAGALGNAGQGDYAAGNGFMDQYAQHRQHLAAQGRRHGRTLSIDWPLWAEGGMRIDAASQRQMQAATGAHPLATAPGLQAFHAALAQDWTQVLVLQGNTTRLRQGLERSHHPAVAIALDETDILIPESVDAGAADERLREYLRRQLSSITELPASRIDVQAPLETYGIDSVMAMSLTRELEKTFPPLSKTLLFEYQTLAALAQYLFKSFPGVVRDRFGGVTFREAAATALAPQSAPTKSAVRALRRVTAPAPARDRVDVAVIGMAGRYPQARDLSEYWHNLRDGRDCITEIPAERWDNSRIYHPDRNVAGKSCGRWGGFLTEIDCFDPLFFGISPKEAALMDPQERLFLETSWQAVEDAGYSRQSLAGHRIGVFVGVMWGHYELLGLEACQAGSPEVAGASHATIANRVSYVFNWHGPSIALDTMCSSSLTAMHLACDAIRGGDSDAAIVGGVNLSLHPHKYLGLSQGRFLSSDGRCRSFGEGGDGYVPGEGVGALLLKRLDHARRDGDHVHAVIRASGINHGGKTNGYSVPNPSAQARLIRDVLARGGVDPATVNYIEAHGTGTALGDPIEISGLINAFGGAARNCPIGSVKSNIGHLESAAGVAAVTKVLLQMRHGELVPSLHAEPANPYIDFPAAGLRVQTGVSPWTPPDHHIRRACVSSFGAGGANGHVVLDQVAAEMGRDPAPEDAEIFLLSARDPAALRRYAESMLVFLDEDTTVRLADITFTVQLGRDAFTNRLAIIAATHDELRQKLRDWLKQPTAAETDGLYQADARNFRGQVGDLVAGSAGATFLAGLLRQRDLPRLAQLWIMGTEIDWTLLHRRTRPRRVSLPTYPFARERYWLTPAPAGAALPVQASPVIERVHYQPQWYDERLPTTADQPSEHTILALGCDAAVAAALVSAAGHRVIWVRWSDTYAWDGKDGFALDPASHADLDRLFAALATRETLPTRVLHRARQSEDSGQIAEDCTCDAILLLHLSQAYMRKQQTVALLSWFEGFAECPAPNGAPIAGFFRTLVVENPRFSAATVELRDCGAMSAQDRVALLLAEFSSVGGAVAAIRHLGGDAAPRRQLRHLVPLRPPARSRLPVRQGGAYLITGGLGGLGLIFAEHLARSAQAKLILVGRSEAGSAQTESLDRLQTLGAKTRYLQGDVADLSDMQRVVAVARAEFGALSGVIHSAGQTRDAFILKKSVTEMQQVLAPKLAGTLALDQATQDEPLDWFVLFSSVAAEVGNPGQADYAFANGFQDFFSEQREQWRRSGSRQGRCLSINWPLWADGGMTVNHEALARVEQESGVHPLPAEAGLRCWEDLLAAGVSQALVLYGDSARIEAALRARRARTVAVVAPAAMSGDLLGATEGYLRDLIGAEVKLAADQIDRHERFQAYGVESVMIARINARMARDLGPLSKTLLFEHETVAELARHLLAEAGPALTRLFAGQNGETAPPAQTERAAPAAMLPAPAPVAADEPIAIVGIHAQYPHSPDLDAYWQNLSEGRDLIDLVPAERWSYGDYFDADPDAAARGKIYCKWGGFLENFDRFDPAFFNIPADEARAIDPQERLFLQSVWSALEDAGYTREALRRRHPKGRGAAVGVYVGVTTTSYQLIQAESSQVQPTALPWSIANRVSYFFDFEGPSMPIDTACSSSLVALHLASESLRRGDCEVAVAGGVNLYLHPAKYQSLCRRHMVSSDGKCRSYGAGGDGFVPGEGVGTLILKPLSRAVADGDRVHGIIRGSAYAHSGRSNGYSAPNPNAQANLIDDVLRRSGCAAATISYVEGHGTGTVLGDSIEVAALTQAFRRQAAAPGSCALGSVKANIGHAESAAGIAGLIKVLLQMRHGQLAPSLHAEEINPNIDLASSPFYLQRSLMEWPRRQDYPRRALVNSFGAGGVNACVLVEQHEATSVAVSPLPLLLLLLSARNAERLRRHGENLLVHLRARPDLDIAAVCCTLQVGREAMEERLAIFADCRETMIERLVVWLYGEIGEGVLRGRSARSPGAPPTPAESGADLSARLRHAGRAWVSGAAIDWRSFHGESLLPQLSLPTYPFAEARYWVTAQPTASIRLEAASTRLHPLVSHNASTLSQVRFSSPLAESEYYATDHQADGARIFPGAGFIEIALACGALAAETRVVDLRDIVWSHPLSFEDGPQLLRTTLHAGSNGVEFAIGSLGIDNDPILYCEGRLQYEQAGSENGDALADLDAMRQGCHLQIDSAELYRRFAANGLSYGPAFQAVASLEVGDGIAVSRLVLPEKLRGEFSAYTLHPALLDGALQSVAALLADGGGPHLPFALDALTVVRPLPPSCLALIEMHRTGGQGRAQSRSFTIRMVNERGELLVRLGGLHVRPLFDEKLSLFEQPLLAIS